MEDTFLKGGILHCKKCGRALEVIVDMPLFDGSGNSEKKKVGVNCDCLQKKYEDKMKQIAYDEKMIRISQIRNLSLMDNKLRQASLSNYNITSDNEKLHRIASNYVGRFDEMMKKSQGLLLWGDVGTGKSYTAAAIANELIERMRPVVMTSFIKLLQTFDSHYSSDVVERVMASDLLVIDDLGAERSTDYALEKVYNVIDSRYRSGKPIILTTNLNLTDMKNCDDIRFNRIYDRIFEMCYPIMVVGKSWRKKEAVTRFEEMKRLLEG